MKKETFKKEYQGTLPESSGVYFFKYKKDILYIGKATNLKDRVSSYFSNDLFKTRGSKILSMIENANKIEFTETRNVLEAIMLESHLIKKYQPFFNTKEKDNKSYSCVVITKEDFPRVLIKRMREIEAPHEDFEIDEVFGLFTSKDQLVKAMIIIRKIFPFRDKCKLQSSPSPSKGGEQTQNAKDRPCFNFQIGLCPGTCMNKISKKDYAKNIKHIKKILRGETESLLKDLQKEMKSLAKEKDFENAAKVRDKIYAIEHVKDVALISESPDFSENIEAPLSLTTGSSPKIGEQNAIAENIITLESYDVAHISGSHRVGVMCRFEMVKDGRGWTLEYKKSEYKKFKLDENVNDDYLGLSEILERRLRHTEWSYPDLIIIDGGKGHFDLAKKVTGGRISVVSVVKDDKHKAREILFDKDSENLLKNVDKAKYNKFIILANEEAHRFAISYHKLLRNKIKKQ